ncbi:MAG TPA: isocitrate lyase/phosphoenolpyruvate mutase family protein [Pseudonocardiaceae bacterium]|nr:isocitrate lyase/phosphoenolpyruvate mutase family protein [Pseudonocardiaceae bacterium]
MATAGGRRSSDVDSEVFVAQQAMARRFAGLHAGPGVLVLPNAWDAGSAALLARVPGVRALATTSAGMAAAHGLPDGELLGLDHLLAALTQLIRAVALPVTVDLETGYGNTPDEVADSVASVIDAGAVGVNLEDGLPGRPDQLLPAEEHAGRIAAARSAAGQVGVPIVVNARTDVYWRAIGRPECRLAHAVYRSRIYAEAGADCVFVPGFPGPDVPDRQARDLIAELVGELAGTPLNLLANTSLPPVDVLAELGVRRLSVGSALYRLAMAAVRGAAVDLFATGRPDALAGADRLSYQELLDVLSTTGT